MFFLFPTLCHPLLTTIHGTSPYVAVAFGSFGFHSGGSYYLTIDSIPLSNLSFFLPTESEYLHNIYDSINPTQLCFHDIIYSEVNHTNSILSNHFSFSGIIPSSDVYAFVLLNCANVSTEYWIRFDLRNPDSFLDSRVDTYPLCYLIFTFIHTQITILWLFNQCAHSTFAIDFSFTLIFLSSIRAVGAALSATIWWNEQCNFPIGSFLSILHISFTSLYVLLLMNVSALIIEGWCVYRTQIPFNRFLEIVFSSTLIMVTGKLFEYIDDLKSTMALFMILLIMIGIIWFGKVVMLSLFTFIKLTFTDGWSEDFRLRLGLVQRFLWLLFVVALIALVGAFCAAIVRFSVAAGPWIMEFAVAFLHFGQWQIFSLRKKYTGEQSQDDELIVGSMIPRMLYAPGQEELMVMTLENGEMEI
jgi:hypothetical protein